MTTSKNCLTTFSNGKSLWRNLFYGSPEDCKNILDNRLKNTSNTKLSYDNKSVGSVKSYINDYTNILNIVPSEFSIEYYLDRMDYNKNKNDTNNNVSYNEDNIEYEDYIYFMENYEQISNYNTNSVCGGGSEYGDESLSDGTIYSDDE